MKFIIFTCVLIMAVAIASANVNSTLEDHGATWYYNTTFVKVIKTEDIRTRDPIFSTPAVILIGKLNGELLRCLQEDPNECQLFYKANSPISSLAITGEYIYVGVFDVILRCELDKKESCAPFHTYDMIVNDLTVGNGNLHVGLQNGTILRCELHQSNHCRPHYEVKEVVFSLIQHDRYIYAGLNNHQLIRCSSRAENSCVPMYNMSSAVMGLTSISSRIFAVTLDSRLWNCSDKSNTDAEFCVSTAIYPSKKDIAQFNGDLYVLGENGNIRVCKSADDSCAFYAQYGPAASIAFAYGTYQLQSRYWNEHTTCTWQSDSRCPPFVTYYNVQERAALEVHVKDGKLYNSNGILVDTSNADEGRSGPAAIFAMGPDGRLVLSNSHKNELLHTSSLFAGNPVAGVGEIVVKSGVIKKMRACSEHYQPDLYLNRQVIRSLQLQGYVDTIDSQLCCKGNQCANSDPDNVEEN